MEDVPSPPPGFTKLSSKRRQRVVDGNPADTGEDKKEEAAPIMNEEDDEETLLHTALKASAEDFAQRSLSEEEALQSVLELSKETARIREKELEAARRGDEDALALAIELSKQETDVNEDLKRALDASLEQTSINCDQEVKLLDEALRRSRLDSFKTGLLTPSTLLQHRGILDDVHHDDEEELTLALHLSEQVESLERVLDEEEVQEEIKFALQEEVKQQEASRFIVNDECEEQQDNLREGQYNSTSQSHQYKVHNRHKNKTHNPPPSYYQH
mmetsp:Transcript_19679/g.25484  ORF Transcript_19679/g.25484 Transcript_19679/m.25484 type:complete len:272 (+) Transcript_19679:71-886(+)